MDITPVPFIVSTGSQTERDMFTFAASESYIRA